MSGRQIGPNAHHEAQLVLITHIHNIALARRDLDELIINLCSKIGSYIKSCVYVPSNRKALYEFKLFM
jgi:hypothetical protein